MKKIRILSLILCLAIMLGCFTACGSSPKKGIVGDWVVQGGKGASIKFDKDGSFFWYEEHGGGVYTIASDKTLVIEVLDERTTDELTWSKDFDPENPDSDIWYVDGDFMVFWGGFYTRAGKDQEKILKKHLKTDSKKDDKGDDNGTYNAGGAAAKVLDAFDGVNLTVTGISPFCKVSIDTSSCPSEVQQCVEYEADKDCYSNGDSVVITARLSSWAESDYKIKSATKTFKVSDMPEYITSTEGINLDSLIKERDDYVKAKTSEASNGSYLFDLVYYKCGHNCSQYDKVNSTSVSDVYLVSLKQNKLNTISHDDYNFVYNELCFLYKVSFTWGMSEVFKDYYTGKGTMYVNVRAINVVKYPDGTVKWGSKSIDDLDFQTVVSTKSIEDLTATSITSMSADYDIKKITL